MLPYETDYYDICTYAGSKKDWLGILNIIREGFKNDPQYPPGMYLLKICNEAGVIPKNTPAVLKLIEENIDSLKGVYCGLVKGECLNYNKQYEESK